MPFATINGKSLHYTDYQPTTNISSSPSNPTIILIHGLGSTQNYYTPILPHLSTYRCITFDNYGAGRSKYQPETHPTTSIPDIAGDVVGLLDNLKVDGDVVVVGYSMGGMVPSYLAGDGEEEEGFKGRMVAGVCIGPVNPSEAVAEVFRKRVPVVRDGGIETMANTIPTGATGPNTTPLQKAFIREMIMSQDPQGYIANCHAIEHATPPSYSKVQCPMLIIAGEVDKSAPLEGCKFISEKLGSKDKKLEVLDGVGHWHCVEDSERVGRLITGFVDGVVGGSK